MASPSVLIAPFIVTTVRGSESQPTLAAGADGRVTMLWEGRPLFDPQISSYTYEGNFFGTNGLGTIASGGPSANGNSPDVTILSNGSIVGVYEGIDYNNYSNPLSFQILTKNADGLYSGGGGGWLYSGPNLSFQDQPEIAALSDGGFVIAWEDSIDRLIRIQKYDASGVRVGSAYTLPSNDGLTGSYYFSVDVIGLVGGGFAVSYSGATVGSTNLFAVNGSGTVVVGGQIVGGPGTASALAQNTSGTLAFVFTGLDDVVVQMMRPNFTFIGTGTVLSNAANVGGTPRIAAMLDGRFMVVYSNVFSGPLVGQMINADGTLDGAAFTIAPNGSQGDIETLADGRVMVSWSEIISGERSIHAALYDPREIGVNIQGTTGRDNYVGTPFVDTINLNDGNDFVVVEGGADFVTGGAGNDTIYGGLGNNTINGGADSDFVVGGSGDELLQGGAGADSLFGEAGNDRLYAETLDAPAGGGAGDLLIGAAGSDSLYGGGGNDYLYGGSDGDSLEGGAGVDVLVGESGNDSIYGGDGDDVIYSGAGLNFLFGDGGNDVILSEGDTDFIEGGTGSNYYYRVAAGMSQVTGNTGIDQFIGGAAQSADTFFGGDNQDYAYGGAGSDVLIGQVGNDVLIGEAGNDTLEGGSGVNLLWANDTGSDEIRVQVSEGGTQVVEFFEAGGTNDVVRLLGSSLTSFAGIANLVANLGVSQSGNLMVNAGSGAQLYLNLGANQTAIWFQGVSAYSLTSGDFLFV
jgi:Ca2+-binding RTX toxin-like protein